MLRAFNRTTFGLSECHKDIRVQVAYYTEDNRKQFINFIVGDFNQYVKKIRDGTCWGGNQEPVELYYLYEKIY